MIEKYQSVAFLHFPQNYTKDLSVYVGDYRTDYHLESPINAQFAKDSE